MTLKIEGLCRILPLKELRRTPGVYFDMVAPGALPRIDGVDRVIHEEGAFSPNSVGDVERPWYMHQAQEDYLMVLHGSRRVQLYSKSHGQIETFKVTPHQILNGEGEVLFDGPALLGWTVNVFHRIHSSPETGSASINLAVRHEGFDIKSNFNIYELQDLTGEFKVLREGHLDQPKDLHL